MEQASGESSCGSAVATVVLCTIFVALVSAAGLWTIYRLYWKRKYGANRLMVEDVESSKVDYAFDNPAFKAGDSTKNVSPFDTKWKILEKRKTVDDSHKNAPVARLVPLRGSDFTGLGIEVCGGLKEGIYVSKVMPQGPAANIVHKGDKIRSVTIDFRHIVQEDAATILSYASPYNVQLELIEQSGTMSNLLTQHPSQSPLAHPLYRSQSQEDLETIERNARKKLLTNDENSYPTLKMVQQQNLCVQNPRSSTQIILSHDEHEKEKSLKKVQNYIIDIVEEKLQTKSSHSLIVDSADVKKSIKFDTRLLSSTVSNETKNSPNKIQADNDSNTSKEKNVIQPPEAMKRSKNKNLDANKTSDEFERQASTNASGIKRDSSGIPQAKPAELTILNNRKVNSIDRKYKGPAPRPPNFEGDDSVDHVDRVNKVTESDDDITLTNPISKCNGQGENKAYNITDQNNENAQQIELSSNYITVHQVPEEDTGDERKTASLGDLSTLGVDGNVNIPQTNDGTLERAQSLEISDPNNSNVNEKVTSEQCKSHSNNVHSDGNAAVIEPCFGEQTNENLVASQTARLKSSYEWGNLEDAIFDGKECLDTQLFDKKLSSRSIDLMSEVLAAADKFDFEINDIKLSDLINDDLSSDTNIYAKPSTKRVNETQTSFIISHKSNDKLDTNEEIATQEGHAETDISESAPKTQNVSIHLTEVELLETSSLEIGDLDNVDEILSTNTKCLSEAIQKTGLTDDAKVSKLTYTERPKSEVLKKSIFQQSPEEDFENGTNGISCSQNILNTKPMCETAIAITDTEPVNLLVSAGTNSNMSKSQASPIFPSDFQGVSNISISSTDSNSFNDPQAIPVSPFFTELESSKAITIETDHSQPSKITFENEKIDFEIQAVDEVVGKTDSAVSSKPPHKNEVFIVESLSSKKLQDSLLPVSNGNSRGFVTEIRFQNSNRDKKMNGIFFGKSLEVQNEDYDAMKLSNMTRVSPSKIPVFTSQKSTDNIHRNNGNMNRVSVTSIKNSSRNPSGK